MREALERFADGTIIVWIPQLQLLEAAQLPQRLKATVQTHARTTWLHAQLTVARPAERGLGLLGSHVLVVNPPHTLRAELAATLPWLAEALGEDGVAQARVDLSPGA